MLATSSSATVYDDEPELKLVANVDASRHHVVNPDFHMLSAHRDVLRAALATAEPLIGSLASTASTSSAALTGSVSVADCDAGGALASCLWNVLHHAHSRTSLPPGEGGGMPPPPMSFAAVAS